MKTKPVKLKTMKEILAARAEKKTAALPPKKEKVSPLAAVIDPEIKGNHIMGVGGKGALPRDKLPEKSPHKKKLKKGGKKVKKLKESEHHHHKRHHDKNPYHVIHPTLGYGLYYARSPALALAAHCGSDGRGLCCPAENISGSGTAPAPSSAPAPSTAPAASGGADVGGGGTGGGASAGGGVGESQHYVDFAARLTESPAMKRIATETDLRRGADQLEIGDTVQITGDVSFKDQRGKITGFGKDKRFVLVKLQQGGGEHSFHSSDVSELQKEPATTANEEDVDTFYVAFYDESEQRAWIGKISKEAGGKWHESNHTGKADRRWGQSYMAYLKPADIMNWIHKDYHRGIEIEGPFLDPKEALEHVKQNWGRIEENVNEQALTYAKGFDITTADWKIFCEQQKSAELVKKLHDNVELKKLTNGKNTTYSLWVDNKPVSGAITNPKDIHGTTYQYMTLIISDPEQNGRGYASSLIWELYLALKDKLLLGGAISPKGTSFLAKFLKQYKSSQPGKKIKVIDDETGDVSEHDVESEKDVQQFLNDHHLYMMLECWPLNAHVGQIGNKKMWLFDHDAFVGSDLVAEDIEYTKYHDWKQAVLLSYPAQSARIKFRARMEGTATTIIAAIPGEDRVYGLWDDAIETGEIITELNEAVKTTEKAVEKVVVHLLEQPHIERLPAMPSAVTDAAKEVSHKFVDTPAGPWIVRLYRHGENKFVSAQSPKSAGGELSYFKPHHLTTGNKT